MPKAEIIKPLGQGRYLWRVQHPYYYTVYAIDPDDPIRVLGDGREIVVMPWSFNGAQLSTSKDRESGYWDDTWNYVNITVAVLAASSWNGEGDPPGWYRHPRTGRYNQ